MSRGHCSKAFLTRNRPADFLRRAKSIRGFPTVSSCSTSSKSCGPPASSFMTMSPQDVRPEFCCRRCQYRSLVEVLPAASVGAPTKYPLLRYPWLPATRFSKVAEWGRRRRRRANRATVLTLDELCHFVSKLTVSYRTWIAIG